MSHQGTYRQALITPNPASQHTSRPYSSAAATPSGSLRQLLGDETAYLSFRDQELSNDIWLVEFRRRKVVVHAFLWVVPGHCLRAGIMESRNFFCLTLYPGEISHSDSANRELSNDVLPVVVRRIKVAPHTSSHLTPIEA